MGQRDAVDLAVEALRAQEVFGDGDAAEIAAVEALADAVDAASEFSEALWREYRLALKALREARPSDSNDGTIDELIASLRGAAPVGDRPN